MPLPNQPPLDPATDVGGALPPPDAPMSVVGPQARNLLVFAVLLVACFAKPIYALIRFAAHSELFSHILLIPFISGYLVWIKKDSLPHSAPPARGLGLAFFAAGLLVFLGHWAASHSGMPMVRQNHLVWSTLSWFLLFVGGCVFFLPRDTVRAIAFPLGFLIFMVPLPAAFVNATETFLQHASATAADWFFTVTDTTFFRDGLAFQLTDIRIQVAPECSGIHSTVVLFITSLLAGQMFLVSPWKRALLALTVIPLGILRNGFRIWTIGQLCIHVSPDMIDSPIHHRGGPLFFVLSLIPFCLLLLYLRRTDQKFGRRK